MASPNGFLWAGLLGSHEAAGAKKSCQPGQSNLYYLIGNNAMSRGLAGPRKFFYAGNFGIFVKDGNYGCWRKKTPL
jgi:hypothetical protein